MNRQKDYCKGLRKFYNAILRAIVASPLLSGLMMGLPTYFLVSGVIAGASFIVFIPFFNGFVFSLLAFTCISWLLELWAIRKTLPNLLHACAFFHSAIGSWWFVNFFILLFAGWKYIPFSTMWNVLALVLTPSFIWYVTGDIILAYKRKQIAEIEASHHIDQQFIVGAEKV